MRSRRTPCRPSSRYSGSSIAQPPLAWGSPEHVERLFAGSGLDLTFEREELPIDPDIDPKEATEFYLSSFGPLIKAREQLEAEGRWGRLAGRLPDIIERLVREPAAYLAISGRKQGPRAETGSSPA